MTTSSAGNLTDQFGRSMSYLRVSVTDRCNFKCIYCLPSDGISMMDRQDILSFEEIERVVRAVVPLGIQKVRLTGGEPLVRKGLCDLVSSLNQIEGIKELCLTTNGSMLSEYAPKLKAAGLASVNISLDTLNAQRFSELTLTPLLQNVLDGIDAAKDVGLRVKINVVPLKGTSLYEVLDLIYFAQKRGIEIRFIEFMPLCGGGWSPDKVLPIPQLRAWVQEHFVLEPLPRGSEVAESYKIEGSQGRVGFIASLSEPFCSDCNRLRLSSNGKIRPCLFSTTEYDLLKKLREGCGDEEIQNIFRWGSWNKPEGHQYRALKPKSVKEPKLKTALIRSIGG